MPTELFVPLTEVRLRVLEWPGPPEAVPVVLLPATGETADDWDVVAAALQPTRRVYAVDLRGHGGSDWTGDYAIARLAHDVGELLAHLGGPLDLVGHSLGGLVACRVAQSEPTLVRRLVLEDVGLLHPRTPAPPDRPAGELRFDWAVVEQVRPQIDRPAEDWPGIVAAIQAPLLVIAGGTASPVAAEHVHELVDLVADGRVVTIEAGHLVHDAEPEAFVRALQEFLDA